MRGAANRQSAKREMIEDMFSCGQFENAAIRRITLLYERTFSAVECEKARSVILIWKGSIGKKMNIESIR